MTNLIKTHQNGCDFIIEIAKDRLFDEITLLQLTDTQIINEAGSRTKERLGHDERTAWSRENIAKNCYNHIRSLVAQSRPDLIFFTGDVVYGSFDDNGEILADFIGFMDSLRIPWTMVFGNHDNEAKIGVAKQCEMLENSEYCLFKRGNVSGNSNFTVGISCGNKLRRILYMLDSNGCIADAAIHDDQLDFMRSCGETIGRTYGDIPGFMAFHIPVDIFHKAEYEKGYSTPDAPNYLLGVDTEPKDGDFGFNREEAAFASPYIETSSHFEETLTACRIDGIFVGHCHKIATCINYNGMKLVFGLKTGQYDYHLEGQLGGTAITLAPNSEGFKVHYLPSLVPHGPFPANGSVYTNNFLVE